MALLLSACSKSNDIPPTVIQGRLVTKGTNQNINTKPVKIGLFEKVYNQHGWEGAKMIREFYCDELADFNISEQLRFAPENYFVQCLGAPDAHFLGENRVALYSAEHNNLVLEFDPEGWLRLTVDNRHGSPDDHISILVNGLYRPYEGNRLQSRLTRQPAYDSADVFASYFRNEVLIHFRTKVYIPVNDTAFYTFVPE
ncbi:MAG: hypothetical protein ACK417_08470 [Bacteroidia bacterium]